MKLQSVSLILGLLLCSGVVVYNANHSIAQSQLNKLLIQAIKINDTKTVAVLLRRGADPNAVDDARQDASNLKEVLFHPPNPSALLVALDWRSRMTSGHVRIAGYNPADPPLENITLVKLLLDKGAKLNVINEIGLTPLHIAAWQGKAATVELLLHYGAKVNALGTGSDLRAVKTTPLMLAATNGNIATINALVSHGADIDTLRDAVGCTALTIAKGHSNAQVVTIMETALKKSSKARKR